MGVLVLRHAEIPPAEEAVDTLKPPIALRRMFSESRMREIRLSGLMRGGSWLTHLGQLLPALPPLARPRSCKKVLMFDVSPTSSEESSCMAHHWISNPMLIMNHERCAPFRPGSDKSQPMSTLATLNYKHQGLTPAEPQSPRQRCLVSKFE